MFPVSRCIFSLLDISIHSQISYRKKSILSEERPIRPIVHITSSNILFFPPLKNSNSKGTSSLSIFDKMSVIFSISSSYFSSSFFSFITSSNLIKSLVSCSDKFVSLMFAFYFCGVICIYIYIYIFWLIIFVMGLEKLAPNALVVSVSGRIKFSSEVVYLALLE